MPSRPIESLDLREPPRPAAGEDVGSIVFSEIRSGNSNSHTVRAGEGIDAEGQVSVLAIEHSDASARGGIRPRDDVIESVTVHIAGANVGPPV